MKNNYIINRDGIRLRYKIDWNKFIFDFDFFVYSFPIYKKDIEIKMNFWINYILQTSLTYIWDPRYSNSFKYINSFKVLWLKKNIILNLEDYWIDLKSVSYVDFDLILKLVIDDSIFFDTTIHRDTDIKKVWKSYIIY